MTTTTWTISMPLTEPENVQAKQASAEKVISSGHPEWSLLSESGVVPCQSRGAGVI
jgi:hypothetical protein